MSTRYTHSIRRGLIHCEMVASRVLMAVSHFSETTDWCDELEHHVIHHLTKAQQRGEPPIRGFF